MKRAAEDVLRPISRIKTAKHTDAWNEFNKFHYDLADYFTDKPCEETLIQLCKQLYLDSRANELILLYELKVAIATTNKFWVLIIVMKLLSTSKSDTFDYLHVLKGR